MSCFARKGEIQRLRATMRQEPMKQHASPSHNTDAQDEADEREFETYARTQNPVQVQAALWATRRTEGLGTAAEAEFQDWLRADPAHADAFQEMARGLDPVRQLPGDKVQSLRDSLRHNAPRGTPAQALNASTGPGPAVEPLVQPASRPTKRPPLPALPSRRAWMAGIGRLFPQAATAVAAVALVGGGWTGWAHWRSQPTFAKNYATERGQRLDVQLPDGSTLQLDAATQAEVRLYRERREVRLLEGQAFFIVSADPQRPFDVLAGAMHITVVGTRFSVRRTFTGLDAGKSVLAVESGRVRVSQMGASGPARADKVMGRVELTGGQGVTVDEGGRLQPIVNIAPASVAAWRTGRISFNDTPLTEALAELERYGNTGLVVLDPTVGALRLGGSFNVRQVDALAQALPSLLPVRLERRHGVVEIMGRH
jgi:transmembrane sensor